MGQKWEMKGRSGLGKGREERMDGNRFTQRAQAALRLARESAAEMGHGYVGSEHLLLGLAREGRGVAARVLESGGPGCGDTALRRGPGGGTGNAGRASLPGPDPPVQAHH